MSKVYFIGAGPGDPELITLKGRRLLDEADVVIYAGSLVNPVLLDGITARIHDSAKMALEEIVEIMKDSVAEGKTVVRLHTGDTSFYSAISEQIERLREARIDYEVVPGVSSAMAGAAVLGQELTIPEISQTVILTRIEGRTPVPQGEKLSEDWQSILRISQRLSGHLRHLSLHCGGLIVVPDEIRRYVPMEVSAKGLPVIQWEKDQAEAAGLVKIDILGNRSLAVIRDALAAVKRNTGIEIDYASWRPLDDRRTRELLESGETMGCFYIESPATRQLLKRIWPAPFTACARCLGTRWQAPISLRIRAAIRRLPCWV